MKERKTKSEERTKRKKYYKPAKRYKCEFGFPNLAIAANRGFDETSKEGIIVRVLAIVVAKPPPTLHLRQCFREKH